MGGKDGGPAFPCEHIKAACNARDGMSLRDWFAGLVMQAWISTLSDVAISELDDAKVFKEHQIAIAKVSYGYADAMLKESSR